MFSVESPSRWPVRQRPETPTAQTMREFMRDLRIAKLSPATIEKRIEIVERVRAYLAGRDVPVQLVDADPDVLRDWQSTISHLQPRSVDIYVRHVQSFFRWAEQRRLVEHDPSVDMVRPRLPKCRPHPMTLDEIRLIFATTQGVLRVVFALAIFAGLRRGEICRLQRQDIDLDHPALVTALIHGKGDKERIVPLLAPVMDELYAYGLPRTGYVVLDHGRPYEPERLTIACHRHLRGLGLETTLHSGRHSFATHLARMTRDPVFLKGLLGHESLNSTMIYVESDMSDAHLRMAPMATMAQDMLSVSVPARPALRAAGEAQG